MVPLMIIEAEVGIQALAYDAAFGWDDAGGKVGDMRDDVEFYSEIWFRRLYPELFGTPSVPGQRWNWPNYPASRARREFIHLVNDLPQDDDYYPGPVPAPGAVIANVYFSTHWRTELEAETRGRISQNVCYVYSLSDADRAYLQYPDPTMALDGMLTPMSTMTGIRAEPRALAHLRRVSSYSDRARGPILLAHNVADGITPVEDTAVCADLMASTRTQGPTNPRLLRLAGPLQLHGASDAGVVRNDG